MLQYSDISAAWLTEVLTQNQTLVAANVISVDQLSIGTGQVGENVRFSLTWDVEHPQLPDSVVGKFPSPDPTSRAAAEATRTYEREVGFYRDLQPEVAIRTPKVYYLAEQLSENDFTLIMEDITPSVVGDQIAGCDVETATQVVHAAAALHGSTWGTASHLQELSWIDAPTQELIEGRAALGLEVHGCR